MKHLKQATISELTRLGMVSLVLSLPGCSGCESQAVSLRPSPETANPDSDERSIGDIPEVPNDSTSEPRVRQQPERDQGSIVALPVSETEGGPSGARGDANVGAESTGKSANGTERETAQEALEKARGLHERSREKSQSGDFSAAFIAARDGWQLLQRHQDDPDCQKLAEVLIAEMDGLAKKANAASGVTPDDIRPLIER